MVTDKQVKILMTHLNMGKPLAVAAAHADMDVKTARKWANSPKRPSETTTPHDWRTREDPFHDVWEGLERLLTDNPGLQAKTLFDYLQRQYPGRFPDAQLRTLQRRVKHWRATQGPQKEVFFPQVHHPGEVAASDFTHMKSLGIRIAGQEFAHLLYHFVLTYSNWETVSICFSESLEALSEGLQRALFELGGVPTFHRTDRLSAAVLNWSKSVLDETGEKERTRADFTRNYQRLLDHYGLQAQRTQAGHGNENGDAEQRHHRLKQAIDQALLLPGHRDFDSRADYEQFLRALLTQLNAGRRERFLQEKRQLAPLPKKRLEALRILDARVGPASTIYLLCNVYSVPSRLIGEKVQAHIGAETIAIYLGNTRVETLPRVRGRGQHKIDYRHVIGWSAGWFASPEPSPTIAIAPTCFPAVAFGWPTMRYANTLPPERTGTTCRSCNWRPRTANSGSKKRSRPCFPPGTPSTKRRSGPIWSRTRRHAPSRRFRSRPST